MVVNGLLFVVYNFAALQRVKDSHTKEMNSTYHEGETTMEKLKREVKEPALEPGSVV